MVKLTICLIPLKKIVGRKMYTWLSETTNGEKYYGGYQYFWFLR